MLYNRRKFIKGITAAAATIPFTGALAGPDSPLQYNNFPISFFTKPLDSFELPFMAESLAMAGVDGFDLTVRPKGRIEPEKVADDLPLVIETGHKYGLKTEMMVTAITRVDEPFTKRVLETAAKMGVKYYRMGWYDYDFKKGIVESLADIKQQLVTLARFNKETGIRAGYQNHSGNRVGAPVWDMWELIKNIPSGQVSSQFDVCHAVTEGAFSWLIALHLLSKHIGSLAIKDFTWSISGGKAKVIFVPLGEGIVDFDLYFKTLKELNIAAPITHHVEYPLLSPEDESLSLVQKQRIIVAKIKKDVDFIRSHLVKYQLV
jgi:L-ribulose-5-phosphate 3-epimerase